MPSMSDEENANAEEECQPQDEMDEHVIEKEPAENVMVPPQRSG